MKRFTPVIWTTIIIFCLSYLYNTYQSQQRQKIEAELYNFRKNKIDSQKRADEETLYNLQRNIAKRTGKVNADSLIKIIKRDKTNIREADFNVLDSCLMLFMDSKEVNILTNKDSFFNDFYYTYKIGFAQNITGVIFVEVIPKEPNKPREPKFIWTYYKPGSKIYFDAIKENK